jgi:PAS domain S-box-containing protein
MAENKPSQAMLDQQAFLSAVLEHVEDAIVACDAEGRLILFNRAAREFHGLPEEPIPADEWASHYDLYLPDGRTLMTKEELPLFRALQGDYVSDVEMIIAPKNLATRTLHANARPLFDSSGRQIGALAIMHDITERKHAQDNLRRENKLMQALMDNIPDAIYFKDTESRFTRVNRHAPYRGNNAPLDVVGKTDFDFFIEAHARAAYEAEQEIIRTGQPMIDAVEKETYPDGSITWLSTTKVPIFDEAGKVTGIVGISRDITERKRGEEERIQLIHEQAAREEAEAANRFKDEFLAIVSHELRTPLTSILGWSSLLRREQHDQALLSKALEAIERNAQAQKRIIDDLLDVSRIITGKLHLKAISFDPAQMIQAAINAVRPTVEAKAIKVEMAVGAGAERIVGDPDRLQQIVSNLLSNAAKFTPEGGRIEVHLTRTDNLQFEVSVSDTGIGIPAEFLPHVFDRFRQADSSTSRNHGGLGLGLSIVRHLVELHGGSVHVSSPGEGQGATFAVRLPMTAPQQESDFEAQPAQVGEGVAQPERNYPLRDLRVLLVDDEPDTLEMLTAVLKQSGAVVATAKSTAEALQTLERWLPDVLISDIGMPGEDGFELLRRMRTLPLERGGGLPAAALTAYAHDDDRLRTLSAGFQTHISKPINPTEFVEAIASLAGRTRATL